jgi:hypothetical protein
VGFAPTGAVETAQVSDFAICSLCSFGPSFEMLVRIEDVSMIPSRSMPSEHIVALLIEERDQLNRAIEPLQGPLRRRGRPPKALAT